MQSFILWTYHKRMSKPTETFLSISFEWPKLFKYEIIFFRFTELYVVCIYRDDRNGSGCNQEHYLNKDDHLQLQKQCQNLITHPSITKKTISHEEAREIYYKHYLMDMYWQQSLLSDYNEGQSVTERCKKISKNSIESVFNIISAKISFASVLKKIKSLYIIDSELIISYYFQ